MQKPNKTLNACILYIAALSGVGYSSGQEIRIFFVRYGRFGLVTLSAVPIILFSVSLIFILTSRKKALSGACSIFIPDKHKYVEEFVNSVIFLVMVLGVVLPITATGSLMHRLFGIPVWLGNFVLTVLLAVALFVKNMRLVIKMITPVMYIFIGCICFVCIYVLTSNEPAHEPVYEREEQTVKAIWSMLEYVSYNLLALFGVLFSIGRELNSAKSAVICSTIGPVVIGATVIMQYFTIVKLGSAAFSSDMPMLYVASYVSPYLHMFFGLCILFGCFSTSLSCFNSLLTSTLLICKKLKLRFKNKYYVVAGFCLTVAFILSLWGFSNIIAYAYPVIGTLGLPIHILLIFSFFRAFKYSRN